MKRVAVTLMGASTIMAIATPVSARIIFCNNYPYEVYFSIAYQQFQANGDALDWLSRGWLGVETGKCEEFDSAIAVSEFYWRGETNFYKQGKGRARDSWPSKDGKKFWNVEGDFQFYQADHTKPEAQKPAFSTYEKSFRAKDGPVTETITILEGGQVTSDATGAVEQ